MLYQHIMYENRLGCVPFLLWNRKGTVALWRIREILLRNIPIFLVITNILRTFARYNLIQNIMANNYQPFNRSLLAMAALQALPLSLFAQNTGEKPNILYIMCQWWLLQQVQEVQEKLMKKQ